MIWRGDAETHKSLPERPLDLLFPLASHYVDLQIDFAKYICLCALSSTRNVELPSVCGLGAREAYDVRSVAVALTKISRLRWHERLSFSS